jgi:hypothetical protein
MVKKLETLTLLISNFFSLNGVSLFSNQDHLLLVLICSSWGHEQDSEPPWLEEEFFLLDLEK